ncbi:hypothetical protein LTR37_009423 [Vermiconidia calcicola]|uniref:Uncharacterized protein n=1 Tax=Vermiconidia calcicola TaxID=1690605 RepID=A0ACC3N812_9PEZI|nr:hypothetical protein LTR37_009423 [Vermiconidia calcicola]
MAEVAGIVISGIGLVALATTVVDCFEKVDTGRNLGKDYEHYSLQLELAHLAYQRWLKSVQIGEHDKLNVLAKLHVATEQESNAVEKLLGHIKAAFAEAERDSRIARSQHKARGTTASSEETDETLADLGARVRLATKKRQKDANVIDKIRWVVHESKAFETLSERQFDKRRNLAAADLAELAPPGDSRRLNLLLATAKDVDPILFDRAAQVERKGHYFENAKLAGRAKAFHGNQYAVGAQDPGTRHEFRNVSASDEAMAFYGDTVGMPSFWDKT